MNEIKLSSKQVENWRKILVWMIGPYAQIMSIDEIQRFRDTMQKKVDTLKLKPK